MGMVWLLAAAAAKKASESHHHHGKSTKRSGWEDSSDDSHVYSSPSYSYYDCILADTYEKNSKLSEFFNMLLKEFRKVMEEEKNSLAEKRDDTIGKFDSVIPTFIKVSKYFEEHGIRFTHSLDSECYDYNRPGVFIEEHYYDLNCTNTETILLSDIDSLYERLSEQVSNLENNVRELQLERNSKQEIVRKAIFKRKQKKSSLESTEEKLSKVQSDYNKAVKAFEKIKLFKELLNEETKKDLAKGIKELNSLIKLRKEVCEIQRKLRYIEYNENNDERYSLAFERLFAKGLITPTTLERIFLLLDKVEIKARRGELDFSEVRSWRDETLRDLIKWFVKNVYEMDENFVERNYDLPEEALTRKKKK